MNYYIRIRPLFGELIDTLWNVNNKTDTYCVLSKIELIDTLWNVNVCLDSAGDFGTRN